MTDDVKDVDTKEPEVTQTVELSEEEQRASDSGWVPEEEWKGNPKDWRGAKEFNERGEFFSKIKSQAKDLQELKQAMSFLTKQQQAQWQAGFDNAVRALTTQRNAAIEAEDHVTAANLNDKLSEARDAAKQAKAMIMTPQPQVQQVSEGFKSWKSKESWYETDESLTDYADTIGLRFRDRTPDSTEADMLRYVSKRIRSEFPNKFPKDGPPSPDGGGSNSKSSTSKTSVDTRGIESNMTEQELSIMKTICKSTGMSKADFLKQYSENKR